MHTRSLYADKGGMFSSINCDKSSPTNRIIQMLPVCQAISKHVHINQIPVLIIKALVKTSFVSMFETSPESGRRGLDEYNLSETKTKFHSSHILERSK